MTDTPSVLFFQNIDIKAFGGIRGSIHLCTLASSDVNGSQAAYRIYPARAIRHMAKYEMIAPDIPARSRALRADPCRYPSTAAPSDRDGHLAHAKAYTRIPRRLTAPERIPTIRRMDTDIQQLSERVRRLLEITRQLAEENHLLRGRLGEAVVSQTNMQQRLVEARARVESALARLPLPQTPDKD